MFSYFSNSKSRKWNENPFQMPMQKSRNSSAVLVFVVTAIAVFVAGFATVSTSLADVKVAKPVELAANFVRPNDVNSGSLLFPSSREGYYVEAPRVATDVVIEVNGPISRTKVTQRFENPSEGWVEGIYVFPLPEESGVDTLKMQIGGRLIEGIIKPRQEARQIYEQAKRDGKKASLLEQQRPNIFTNAVANIGPGETIIIQIEYQTTVKQDNGTFSLRFPMVVAPRYNPRPIVQTVDFRKNDSGSGWGVVDPVPDRDKITTPVLDPRKNAKINPVALTVKLAAGFPLDLVKSHHHEVATQTDDESTRTLVLKNETVPADRDFELTWTAKGTAPSAALFTQKVDNDHYMLAFITPPKLTDDQIAQLKKMKREIVFIIDNSGSMGGESIVQAKQALENALRRLGPEDLFNIVRFDDTQEIIFPASVPADRENLDTALRFVRNLQAQGGTEMLPALQMALVDHHRNSSLGTDRIRQVVFITDGAIGNEQQLFNEIGANRGRSRIFTIGIGSAPNSFFMNRAAEVGRGTFTHIGSTAQVAERMNSLFSKLENPVLTGLRAVVSGGNASEVTPDPLPDLYLGEPIVLSAKMSDKTGTLNITGDFSGTPWEVSMDLANATEGDGIGKFWARRKIASLEANKSSGGNWELADKQIEETALAHHLVSRMTSLVAVDVTKSRPDRESLTTRDVPLNLPKGWEFDKVFGDQSVPANSPGVAPKKARFAPMTLQDQAQVKTRSLQVAQLMNAAPTREAAAVVARQTRSVTLPQTATPAEKQMILGAMLLFLAMMIWVVARMYRITAWSVDSERTTPRNFHLLP